MEVQTVWQELENGYRYQPCNQYNYIGVSFSKGGKDKDVLSEIRDKWYKNNEWNIVE